MALWPSPGDLFGIAVRSQGALEEAATYYLQKQACVQKVASSSPKTSWENVVEGEHEKGLTHPLTNDRGTFHQRDLAAYFVKLLPQVSALAMNVLFVVFAWLNES